MIKQVICYQTDDGVLHRTEAEADKAAFKMQFLLWYDNNKLYGTTEGSRIEGKELMEWLTEHAACVKKLLEVIDG